MAFVSFRALLPFRGFAARREATQGLSKPEGLAIRVFAARCEATQGVSKLEELAIRVVFAGENRQSCGLSHAILSCS